MWAMVPDFALISLPPLSSLSKHPSIAFFIVSCRRELLLATTNLQLMVHCVLGQGFNVYVASLCFLKYYFLIELWTHCMAPSRKGNAARHLKSAGDDVLCIATRL